MLNMIYKGTKCKTNAQNFSINSLTGIYTYLIYMKFFTTTTTNNNNNNNRHRNE